MILIAVLFLVPIYYLAKSKGRNAAGYSVVAAVLAVVAMYAPLAVDLPALGLLQLALPAAVLLFVALLRPEAGAPGKAYLKITFACPECHETVTFPREREGVADLCPKCGELISVPTDEYSPASVQKDRTKPEGVEGEVCFERFGRQEPADQLAAIFCDNGIPSRVFGGDGGVLVGLGVSQGYKVVIDSRDWDKAVAIEKECQT